jgi:hypothetical protein
MSRLQDARINALLNKSIISVYGTTTIREWIEQSIDDGSTPIAIQVYDDKLRAKLQKEYYKFTEGFNVPFGNENHPKTIKAQAMRDRLNGDILTLEYRLVRPDKVFCDLNKTEYDYAVKVYERKQNGPGSSL